MTEQLAVTAPGAEVARSQLIRYARDIKRLADQEKRKTRELAEAHRRLRRLDDLKTDFLAFISHELRTPLNHMAAVQLLDSGAGDQGEVVEMIRDGYQRLAAFLDRGLEYFEWLGMPPPATPERVEVKRLLEGREASPAPGEGVLVWGNPVALARILAILEDNARKFGGGHPVAWAVTESPPWVLVEVRDRGCGFAPDLAEEIFRPFSVQGGRRRREGLGLSLALARAIAEVQGARLRGRSEGEGRGATFEVRMRRAHSGEEGSPA